MIEQKNTLQSLQKTLMVVSVLIDAREDGDGLNDHMIAPTSLMCFWNCQVCYFLPCPPLERLCSSRSSCLRMGEELIGLCEFFLLGYKSCDVSTLSFCACVLCGNELNRSFHATWNNCLESCGCRVNI